MDGIVESRGPVAPGPIVRSAGSRLAPPLAAVPRHGTLRVLLVEDSPLLTARLVELLEGQPVVQSVVACDGESQARTAALAADVVILDLHLKQGTGFGVLKRLQSLGSRPVVFVCTNHDVPGYRRRAFELGADYFLDKSRDLDELPAMLHRLVRGERVAAGRHVHRDADPRLA